MNAAMRLHRFAFLLISTAGIYPVARTDLVFDQTLGEFSMNESDWNTDTSLFDQVANPNQSTEDDFLTLNDGSSDLPLFADNPDVCTDGYQPLSRIRRRSGGYCAQDGEYQDGHVPGDDRWGREAALTQEKIDEDNCPSAYYQGIFKIPVCSSHDTDLIRPSRPLDQDGTPALVSGLRDVWGILSKPFL